jgi:hypothetical protein
MDSIAEQLFSWPPSNVTNKSLSVCLTHIPTLFYVEEMEFIDKLVMGGRGKSSALAY